MGEAWIKSGASARDSDCMVTSRAPKDLRQAVLLLLPAARQHKRYPDEALSRRLAAPRRCGAAFLVSLLAACGGGDSAEAVAVPQDTVRLVCDVSDNTTGKPVADATVTYQGGAREFATQTNADGSCVLDLPATEVAGVEYPAGSVEKPGYEPQTILCSRLQGGQSCTSNVQMIPLAANVSIPVGGGIVMHLGDDRFEGTVNSQFQKKTDGAELVFVIDDWAAKVKVGYTKATVYLDAKGWQTSNCANTIALSGDVGTGTLPGGNSPSDGYWAGGKQVPFEFSVARVGTQRAEVRVTAGTCNGTTDLDDFEINRIRVYFS